MRRPLRLFKGLAYRALHKYTDSPAIFYAQKRALVITADPQVQSIASRTLTKEWTILFVASLLEAQEVVLRQEIGVVLLDRDAPGVDWQMAMHCLSDAPYRACVIGLSRNANRQSWEEVTDLGGYDLLPKPLVAEALLRATLAGWSYWCSQKTIRRERYRPDTPDRN